jgi:hypothetical protein
MDDLIRRLRAEAEYHALYRFAATANLLNEAINRLQYQESRFELQQANQLMGDPVVPVLYQRIAALTKEIAEIRQWLDNHLTYMDVDHTAPTTGCNIPALSAVSNRIWCHATLDKKSFPFSSVMDKMRQP